MFCLEILVSNESNSIHYLQFNFYFLVFLFNGYSRENKNSCICKFFFPCFFSFFIISTAFKQRKWIREKNKIKLWIFTKGTKAKKNKTLLLAIDLEHADIVDFDKSEFACCCQLQLELNTIFLLTKLLVFM